MWKNIYRTNVRMICTIINFHDIIFLKFEYYFVHVSFTTFYQSAKYQAVNKLRRKAYSGNVLRRISA